MAQVFQVIGFHARIISRRRSRNGSPRSARSEVRPPATDGAFGPAVRPQSRGWSSNARGEGWKVRELKDVSPSGTLADSHPFPFRSSAVAARSGSQRGSAVLLRMPRVEFRQSRGGLTAWTCVGIFALVGLIWADIASAQNISTNVSSAGIRRYTPGSWSAVSVDVRNPTDADSTTRVATYFEKEAGMQFARDVGACPFPPHRLAADPRPQGSGPGTVELRHDRHAFDGRGWRRNDPAS